MSKLSRSAALFGLAITLLLGQPAIAQEPTLRIVFPYAAGGSADAVARLIAEHLQKKSSRAVIVENKPGAGGRIGAQAVKDAPANGSTLLFAASPQITLQPHILSNLGYDPFSDFAPLARVVKFDQALAVSGKVPVRSIKELAAWVRASPDRAVFGSPGAGTAAHLAVMVVSKTFDLNLRHVAYKGTPAALPDLLEGRLPLYMANNAELMEHHKAGGIRIVAIAGASRSPFLPEVPTLKESGVAFSADGWFAFYAPARTPPEILGRLEKAILAAARSTQVKDRIQAMGFAPASTSAAELARIQRAEFDAWANVVKATSFKSE
jgi:tripartite-type tricarboxylate transporter receptor subunit TctC